MRSPAWGWPVAAAAAAGFIALLALHGERPEPGMARFAPAGLLAGWQLQQVVTVEIADGAGRRVFRRDAGGVWQAGDGAAAAELARQIGDALTLLRNSPPQRSDLAGGQLDEFGLDPPRLSVTARTAGGDSLTIEFGGANPLGLERYARVAGRPGILLMPGFVADAWGRLAPSR